MTKMILGVVKESTKTYDGIMHTISCVVFTNQYNTPFSDVVDRLQLDYETKEIAETLLQRGTITGLGRDANRCLYEDDYLIYVNHGRIQSQEFLVQQGVKEMLVFGEFNGEKGWQVFDGESFTPVYLYV